MAFLTEAANRGSVPTGYDIDNSVKLEAGNNEWFYNASPTAGNRKTFTFSFWIKRSTLGNPTASGTMYVAGQGQHGRMFFSSDYFTFRFDDGHDTRDITTKHRDSSAWLHVVVAVDTNQVSSSNRVKIYFNGVQTTTIDFDGGSYPDIQDSASGWFTTNYLTVGTAPFGGSYNAGDGDYDMSGYLADFAAVDGQQLAPTSFGEFDDDSGIWKPKDLSDITWGNEGFYLKFDNSSSLGADSSGNGNNLSVSNLAAADQATDTPTNNFCTLNPLVFQNVNGVYSFITEGATKARSTQFDVFYTYAPTFGVTSGKWYAEFEYEGSNVDNLVGILDIDAVVPFNSRLGKAGAWSVGLYQANGKLYVTSDSGTTETANWGASAADGDIISVALDMDNHFVYFAKNGTWQNSGVPTSGATGTGGVAFDSNKTVGMGCSTYGYTADGIIFTNLGGYTAGTISSAATDANGYGTFEYAPPSGYYAICTKNLAEYG